MSTINRLGSRVEVKAKVRRTEANEIKQSHRVEDGFAWRWIDRQTLFGCLFHSVSYPAK
jgi:hypothetical protein